MDGMLALLFRRGRTSLYCLCAAGSEPKPPPVLADERWRYVTTVALHPKEQRLAVDSDEAIREIDRHGYYLVAGWYPST